MRDIGYSLHTALADVIDNSITADADRIDVFADTSGNEPALAIMDNGHGMDEKELLDAMRPGSCSPLEERHSHDLGRFGLGLKTASFSQCRKLTVVTRKDGQTSCAIWDLDKIKDDWIIEIPDNLDGIPWADSLHDAGTLVVWEKLDRLVDPKRPDDRRNFVQTLDESIDHLELVFHRFLSGEKGINKISLFLNERKLEAFDPFNSRHTATQIAPEEHIRVGGSDILVQAYTLPHHKKVSNVEWERYAGRDGYVKNQGFYVYREKRLIIHGTWFGLMRQTELTKLARVRVDMPNVLDADWKIDVKKSSAHPPRAVRERLRRIIDTISASSKRTYTSRGRRLVSDSRLPVWNRIQDKNQISYALNPDHPAFASFISKLPDEIKAEFRNVLELVSATIPVDSLFADVGSNPDKINMAEMSDDSLDFMLHATCETLTSSGLSMGQIKEMLSMTEPFLTNWDVVEKKLEEIEKGV
ncbi:MAG: ATP-binding protein [Theionarchaea archaeon]|nr:ATP-binding protein [Theionarchaea archaeon]